MFYKNGKRENILTKTSWKFYEISNLLFLLLSKVKFQFEKQNKITILVETWLYKDTVSKYN